MVSISRSHWDWKLGPAGEAKGPLGYKSNNSSNQILQLSEKKILISKHSRFDESEFPLVQSFSSKYVSELSGRGDILDLGKVDKVVPADQVEVVNEFHPAEAVDGICFAAPNPEHEDSSRRVDELLLPSGEGNDTIETPTTAIPSKIKFIQWMFKKNPECLKTRLLDSMHLEFIIKEPLEASIISVLAQDWTSPMLSAASLSSWTGLDICTGKLFFIFFDISRAHRICGWWSIDVSCLVLRCTALPIGVTVSKLGGQSPHSWPRSTATLFSGKPESSHLSPSQWRGQNTRQSVTWPQSFCDLGNGVESVVLLKMTDPIPIHEYNQGFINIMKGDCNVNNKRMKHMDI
ncbi:hypothetical protein O181_076157 [Austropuccinia psidii MF-1]|uniref:Uncharacterized protein n=1 Tax=Austropuccinia psidii MF-1 TaxID=1389203 RepID=A0A9Q3IDJ1_9BASI|nr:hypothetical protein [Austropuccinia psidii MF-1]